MWPLKMRNHCLQYTSSHLHQQFQQILSSSYPLTLYQKLPLHKILLQAAGWKCSSVGSDLHSSTNAIINCAVALIDSIIIIYIINILPQYQFSLNKPLTGMVIFAYVYQLTIDRAKTDRICRVGNRRQGKN